jgi:hypothetical protein
VYDPYEEFLAFAKEPGLDYSDVEGSDIDELTHQHMYLAVAWSYVSVARFFASGDMAGASWSRRQANELASQYEIAAHQLMQDTTSASFSRVKSCH